MPPLHLVFWGSHGVRGTRRERLGIALQRFHYFGDTAFELRIVPVNDHGGIVFDHDIGIDAVSLNYPLASGGGGAEFGYIDSAAVKQWPVATDAHHASPGALADEGAETCLVEHVRKNVAVGGRGFVNQANLGAKKNSVRIGAGLLIVAGKIHAKQFAAQALDEHAGDVAAAVASHVHNQGLLADLRVVGLDEFADAVFAHIRDVNVAGLVIGSFGYEFAVVVDPFEIEKIGFAGDRTIGDGV